MRVTAIVPAAGVGRRSGLALPKQYAELAGRPLLWHTLARLAEPAWIGRVLVALAVDDTHWRRHDWSDLGSKIEPLFCGGPTRSATVGNALRVLAARGARPDDWVLVHDAARPCLRGEYLTQLAEVLGHDEVGGLLALPVADTVKRADIRGRVAATVPREGLWLAQTPQMFRFAVLRTALERHPEVTDEASAVEAAGLAPKLVEGDPLNLKVTRPGDLALAAAILRLQEEA
ncbi:MAG: 2-C-methyl-D-erythritol 4-phosphate cytidylyltransferase [Tepidiphilus sp.]|nr:2-C-methyl-D-erythritol 4-phosphate cytidylyltransferase [Tepidiphilus sp.]